MYRISVCSASKSTSPVHGLAALEFVGQQPAEFWIAELADKAQHRVEVIDGKIIADINRIGAQQLA